MKRRECQRQRIRAESGTGCLLRRKTGSIEWVTGLFFLLILLVLLCAEIQLSAYEASSLYLEDALATSNLASAVIDIEEYGISHRVRIADPVEAYERYVRAVKENLHLNENREGTNETLISGTVTVVRYVVYNVEDDVVEIYDMSDNGRIRKMQGIPGKVKAPNGVEVVATSIYSEISFPVKGLFGITVQAHKGKLVDIIAERRNG